MILRLEGLPQIQDCVTAPSESVTGEEHLALSFIHSFGVCVQVFWSSFEGFLQETLG